MILESCSLMILGIYRTLIAVPSESDDRWCTISNLIYITIFYPYIERLYIIVTYRHLCGYGWGDKVIPYQSTPLFPLWLWKPRLSNSLLKSRLQRTISPLLSAQNRYAAYNCPLLQVRLGLHSHCSFIKLCIQSLSWRYSLVESVTDLGTMSL